NPYYYTDSEQEKVNETFPECQNISIDYAILEKVEEVFVFPAEFGWSDLGTWGSLQSLLDKDARGNAWVGQDVKLVNTRNCMVHLTEEKKVLIVGLNDYIVAERDGSLLICPLNEEQSIKKYSK
ncbi:MAG: mannose-1-phosphate guanylyltransferase, partial [Bacteroidaceae bacterium]